MLENIAIYYWLHKNFSNIDYFLFLWEENFLEKLIQRKNS